MINPPLEQQLLAGIEERNRVIERQHARIEALTAELAKANEIIKSLLGLTPITEADVQWAKEPLEGRS